MELQKYLRHESTWVSSVSYILSIFKLPEDFHQPAIYRIRQKPSQKLKLTQLLPRESVNWIVLVAPVRNSDPSSKGLHSAIG